MHERRLQKNVKLFIFPFSASFRSRFTAKYESAYINMETEEEKKLLQRELHENSIKTNTATRS